MQIKTRSLVFAAIGLGLAIAVQALRLGQTVTGPTVNAVLDTTAALAGPLAGAAAGVLTPITALLLGQLAPPLAPAVPFIALANGLMVFTFAWSLRYHPVLAVLLSAVVKFGALYIPVHFFLKLPPPVTVALTWPQLFTALIGGAVAAALVPILRRAGLLPSAA